MYIFNNTLSFLIVWQCLDLVVGSADHREASFLPLPSEEAFNRGSFNRGGGMPNRGGAPRPGPWTWQYD